MNAYGENSLGMDPQRPLMVLSPQERHDRRMGWMISEMYRQSESRHERDRCERYYDQEQYSAQQRAELEARGQTPVQYDRITPQIDWLIGTERRMRVDFKILPRDDLSEQARQTAESKTKVLKWVSDTSMGVFHRSEASDDQFKSGAGFTEVYVQRDGDRYRPAIAHVPWRHCVHDSLAYNKMLDGQRFFFRFKPVDTDYAIAMFPGKQMEILKASSDATSIGQLTSWMNLPGTVIDLEGILSRSVDNPGMNMPQDLYNARQRVLLLECWSLEPYTEPGQYSLSDPVGMRPHLSIMTEFDTLFETWSPYQHGKIPFVMKWAYRNKRTGMPYSPIKRQLDRQDALNKAMSRAVHDISTDQLLVEEDAIGKSMTIEQIRDEMDDPGGIAIFAKGAISTGKFKERRGIEKAEPHFMLADRLMKAMDESSSVNKESRGQGSNQASGKMLDIREAQTGVLTAELFDNSVLAFRQEGELLLSLLEQYMNQPQVLPIRGERGQVAALGINQADPATGAFTNDMTAYPGQFIVDEQPWRAAMQQAQFESMMEVIKNLASVAPQVVLALLDIVFEFSDIPNKQSVLERIRTVTGQPGPDNEKTPQQIEAEQKQAQLSALQFQAQMAELQAVIRKAEQEGDVLQLANVIDRLTALSSAAATAQQYAQNPALAPVIDETLRSAGFVDLAPGLPVIPPAAAAAAQAQALPAPTQPEAVPQ